MIKHIWSILCERISIDKKTNLLSYLTCVEEFTVTQLPVSSPILAFGTLWQTDSPSQEKLIFKLILIMPDGSEKVLFESKDFVFEKERHRTNVILNGLTFDQTGTHIFKMQKKQKNEWETVAEIPMKIKLQTETIKSTTICNSKN